MKNPQLFIKKTSITFPKILQLVVVVVVVTKPDGDKISIVDHVIGLKSRNKYIYIYKHIA